jgi:hypothetical protein
MDDEGDRNRPQNGNQGPPVDFRGLAALAAALKNPDAFLIASVAITALIVAGWGTINPFGCLGFALAAITIYGTLSCVRMRHREREWQARVDKMSAEGGILFEKSIKSRLDAKPAGEPPHGKVD